MRNAILRHRRSTPSLHAFANEPLVSLVDRFFNEVGWPVAEHSGGNGGGFAPAMDIVETDDAFVATADLPGIEKDAIEISLDDGMLSISGERTQEHVEGEGTNFRRIERSFGGFRRAFTLPQGVDLEKVKAEFANGVLTLTLPKVETLKARKISIS
ncbi:MAG: Hsp20/alpha crystallin family protein [Acidobacteriota bacterium]